MLGFYRQVLFFSCHFRSCILAIIIIFQGVHNEEKREGGLTMKHGVVLSEVGISSRCTLNGTAQRLIKLLNCVL